MLTVRHGSAVALTAFLGAGLTAQPLSRACAELPTDPEKNEQALNTPLVREARHFLLHFLGRYETYWPNLPSPEQGTESL